MQPDIEGSRCPDCKVGKMEEGKLFGGPSMQPVVFMPSNKAVWHGGNRQLGGWACDRCGYASFRVRVKE